MTTPYLAARREWNERYGSYIAAANNWRLATFATSLIAIIAVSGVVWIGAQHKVVPYAVQIANNEVAGVARADIAAAPNASQIKAAVRNWVIGARTVYVDLRAEQALVNAAYAMTAPDSPAYQTLAAWHREADPYKRAANETVEVEVKAVIQVSDETWQAEWTETTRQRSGKLVESRQWQGSFTLVISPPTSEAQIMVNPLGIYVRQYAWTPRL